MEKKVPTLGFALSGSGDRTTFYIGFFEVLEEENVKVDYIAAMSGASLVAAAYACGSLRQLKDMALRFNRDSVKEYVSVSRNNGGFYSLEPTELKLRVLTKAKRFEDVRPIMSFTGVDIETGELIDMCMGDIAKAACVSCTLPGIFEPSKWGNRTLVDGGLLSQIPTDSLKKFSVDVCVGINMRGTKHIFSEGQMNLKKVFNFFKKILFIEEIGHLLGNIFPNESYENDFEKKPSFFAVLGKSMDLAIKANKNAEIKNDGLDLLITLTTPKLKVKGLSTESMVYYYELGKKSARENLPKILALIKSRQIKNE